MGVVHQLNAYKSLSNSKSVVVFEKKELTIDHVIPKSKGGVTSWENVTTSCKSCNLKKADSIPKVLPKAEKPSYRQLIRGQEKASGQKISSDWQEYIVA